MARFQRWDPHTFLALMHETVPDYEQLQDKTVAATGTDARRVLELGTGTGETARRMLARHPASVLLGVRGDSRWACRRASRWCPRTAPDRRCAVLSA